MKGVEDIYPLSPMQQGMLFHSIYTPHSGAYVEQASYRLEGDVDLDAFAQAWQRLLVRHPILRTAFLWEGLDDPVQVVRTRAEVVYEHQDWQGLSADEQQQRLREFLEQDRLRGFEISRAPLTRYLLAKTSASTHEFVWTFHHLVLDGWSIPLVLRDFFLAYQSIRAGVADAAASPRPFRDYIEWLQQQPLPEAKEFWQRTLNGFSAPTPLGIDTRTGSADPGEGAYAEANFRIGARTAAALQTFGRQQQLTLSTLVLGAWALLLGRYSGCDDVVVGATVSGRSPQLFGSGEMVGMFVNTLPVRAKIDHARAVADWFRDLQAQLVEARRHEHSPLVQIQGWSEVPRGLPLFESIVGFQNQPVAEVLGSVDFGMKVHSLVDRHTWTTYPLTIVVEPGEELALVMVYDARRFEPATLARVAGHLETLLADIAADPARPLHEIELLSEAERALVVSQFNATHSPYERGRLVHESFEEQAHRSAGAAALSYRGQTLSYQELNRCANRIAHRLRELGVGPDDRVAICAPRSFEMVQGVLGILKAGGAYLPLDPNLPCERLAYMLEDASPKLILGYSSIRAVLPDAGLPVLWLDAAEEWATQPEHDPDRAGLTAQHLAYVIYTSGSTGRPKGVMVEHGGLNHYLQWALKAYGAARGTSSVVSSPLAFDATVTSLYLPLLSGGCALLLQEHNEQEELEARLRSGEPLDLVKITPAHLHMLGERFRRDPPGVQPGCFVIGGEALSAQTVALWRQLAPRSRLVNEYGPTETVVGCATFEIAGDFEPEASSVPIGHPIANTQLYLVDRHQQPVPIGVTGELLIGGVQVARGYLNQPQLSAERFIEHPFDPSAGRVYRSGDLGRWRPDGSIEYLGRNDFQVKLRGFRIELGEIEAQLKRCAGVREAAVLAREDRPGDKRLVAYVVAAEGAQLSVPALREALARTLPEYMLPGAFELLASLPLTANGKLDRQALPAPGAPAATTHAYEAPQGEAEQVLARIWTELLGVERVGRHDHFFELGGHSLTAILLLSRIKDEMRVDISLRLLFENAGLQRLAAVVASTQLEKFLGDELATMEAELSDLSAEELSDLLANEKK